MKQYHDMLKHILAEGTLKEDRTGTGTTSVFGYQMRFDLKKGFPIMTTKKIHWKSVVYELLWFMGGNTNNNWLKERGVSIWNEWAKEDGSLGPIYGKQWRSWFADWEVVDTIDDAIPVETDDGKKFIFTKTRSYLIDQLGDVIENIKKNPDSRRHIVSSWNPRDIPKMALPPCHALYQFYVADGKLSCQLYQRSADAFLGVPFNIASYALLTHIVAFICDLDVGHFVHTFGDLHIYSNHIKQVREQLQREPKPLPQLRILYPVGKKPSTIEDFVNMSHEDFALIGYDPYPAIKAPVAV